MHPEPSDTETRCGCSCHRYYKPPCDVEGSRPCCYFCACGAHIRFEHVVFHRARCPERLRLMHRRRNQVAKKDESPAPATPGTLEPVAGDVAF